MQPNLGKLHLAKFCVTFESQYSETDMERAQQITSELLVAYWQCPRKAFLLLDNCQEGTPHELDTIVAKHRRRNRHHYLKQLKDKFGDVPAFTQGVLSIGHPDLSDANLEYKDLVARADILLKLDSEQRRRKKEYAPVLVDGVHSVTQEQRVCLTFAGIVLSRLQHYPCAGGKVLTSDGRSHSVRFGKRVYEVQAIVRILRSSIKEKSQLFPEVVLNKHCPLCPFREPCHAEALQIDHLSLLSGLSQKQIQDHNKKGIFTVTQLAYTYRARRRRRQDSHQRVKYKHPLKALAIRDNRIYVVETEEQLFPRPYMFLEVEGIPSRRFYYLIGLLVVTESFEAQHSFWADLEGDDESIWKQFLNVAAEHDDFTIFHYGSYEGQFIDALARKFGDEENPVVQKIKSQLVNVLGLIYGSIYFPTYSNGLKEIGSYLGHKWTRPDANGLQSIIWRCRWEESQKARWKHLLVTYNQEDCRAVKRVAEAVLNIRRGKWDVPECSAVTGVDSIKSESTYKFGRVDFVLQDFEHINNCAYYDYQREKVYFGKKTQKRRRPPGRGKPEQKKLRINKRVEIPPPEQCKHCGSTMLYRHGPQRKTVLNFRFTESGVKRWMMQYQTRRVRCRRCSHVSISDEYHAIRGKYGHDFYALIVYNSIALRQSYGLISEAFSSLFGYNIGSQICNRARQYFAALYEGTYKNILSSLRGGPLVHVDETTVNLRSNKSYVWVFTSTTEVAYVYSPTRESHVPKHHLKGFMGVLVSDFFSGYDTLDCQKQRCLVHLIRDMNDDLSKNPFDAEFKLLLRDFGVLIRSILSTIEKYGLKRRYLHKHRKDIDRFYRTLVTAGLQSETAVKYRDRLNRWKGELFPEFCTKPI